MPAENSLRLSAARRLSPEFNSIVISIVSSWLLFAAFFTALEPASTRAQGQSGMSSQSQSSQSQSSQAQALVRQTLAAEFNAAQDSSHPMRYLLRKSSPRLITTKEIVETRDGDVARLLSVNDKPLSPEAEQQEQARLDQLLSDPGRQHQRKQSEDDDRARALKILRALPTAFLYEDAGPAEGASGGVSGGASGILEKFTFRPNPSFSPPDLESQVLTQMTGTILIDRTAKRVVRLEGHLQRDIDFAWGILGRLDKGGWIALDEAEVGGSQWRTVRFQMVMSGRVLFKSRSFDTTEEQSRFVPLTANLSYRDAIQLLRSGTDTASTK
jgi:hypothetical protein